MLEEVSLTKVIEYEQLCLAQDKKIKANFPPDIKARIQYGRGFVVDAAVLNTMGLMSASRCADYLNEKYEVTLSASSVVAMIDKVAKKLEPFEEKVRQKLIDSPVVYFDETPVSVKGRNVYVHVGCDKNYTLLKRGTNRGQKGAEDLGIAQKLKGISMSDRFSLYTGKFFENITKAFCGSHRIRDLNKAMLKAPEQHWQKKMLGVLSKMRTEARTARRKGLKEVPRKMRKKLFQEYFQTLELGFSENGPKSPIRNEYCLTLLDSLSRFWAEHTRFFTNLSVDYTNNAAERALRILKIKEKISGSFRSEQGLDNFLLIESYYQTAKKQGLNPIFALKQAYQGNVDYVFTHEALESQHNEPVVKVFTKE